jgi:hypothetical protein
MLLQRALVLTLLLRVAKSKDGVTIVASTVDTPLYSPAHHQEQPQLRYNHNENDNKHLRRSKRRRHLLALSNARVPQV